MPNSYVQGTVVRNTAAFTQGGTALDPTTVSVVIREPNRATTTFVYGTDLNVVRVSQGNYRLDYTTSMPGIHWVYWLSTGTGAGAANRRFDVEQTQVTP